MGRFWKQHLNQASGRIGDSPSGDSDRLGNFLIAVIL